MNQHGFLKNHEKLLILRIGTAAPPQAQVPGSLQSLLIFFAFFARLAVQSSCLTST
jgi:hypothetical protein